MTPKSQTRSEKKDDYVQLRALDNPFNFNYTFSQKDLKRENLNLRTRARLLFHPMLIQITNGLVFHFKIDTRGAIYFFYAEKL